METITSTPDVPFGKSFKVHLQYVFEWKERAKTRIRISSKTVFSKPPVLAGTIRNGVKGGTKETSEMLVELLSAAGGTKRKMKKVKRGKKMGVWVPVSVAAILIGIYFLLCWLDAVPASVNIAHRIFNTSDATSEAESWAAVDVSQLPTQSPLRDRDPEESESSPQLQSTKIHPSHASRRKVPERKLPDGRRRKWTSKRDEIARKRKSPTRTSRTRRRRADMKRGNEGEL